jgi:hypothetical protein
MSLNAIATPAAREPGPMPTRCRSLTVAKVDSIVEYAVERLRCPTRGVEVGSSALSTWLSAVVQKAGPREAECLLRGWFRRLVA